jgi:D-arabinose 1-dehydrogenase-like Zn-dependent alcohol dehydrogenase
MPIILGHEFSGVVTSVGCDVTHLKQGDKVAVDPNRYTNDTTALIVGVSAAMMGNRKLAQ